MAASVMLISTPSGRNSLYEQLQRDLNRERSAMLDALQDLPPCRAG